MDGEPDEDGRGHCSQIGLGPLRRVSRSLWLGMIALALSLPGCGQSPLAVSERAASPRIAAVPSSATAPAHRAAANAAAAHSSTSPGVNQADAAEADWLAAAREDPDPNVRLHALGVWAQRPGTSLDPVTYALVDADESVRARAQELMEQELARR